MPTDTTVLWNNFLDIVRGMISEHQYISFFKPIAFESFDKKTMKLVIQVPNKIFAEYLEEHFAKVLRMALPMAFSGNVRLSYRILNNANEQPAPVPDDTKTKKKPVDDPDVTDIPQIDSNLNPQYTFDSFVEGDSNKLARSIGLSIAEHPRSTKFNPLFIYGPSGCGKTHLINAIGMRMRALYPKKRVLYVSARQFQYQYTNSVIENKTNEFILFYQQFDMLIVDDVQEWESSPRTSETFFHIFNHLFMNGRRIILAADRTPSELRNMDERMITRFSCGVIAELEKPNLQLCIDILHAKLRRDNIEIPNDVVKYIASHVNGSVRDLEGVINSLLAFSMVYSSDIDMPLAEKIVKRTFPQKQHKFDVNTIVDAVCAHFGVQVEDVLSKSRKKDIAQARQVAMYLSQKLAHAASTSIGRLIGGRDHSTVIHSVKQVEQRLTEDKAFERDLKAIEKTLKNKK